METQLRQLHSKRNKPRPLLRLTIKGAKKNTTRQQVEEKGVELRQQLVEQSEQLDNLVRQLESKEALISLNAMVSSNLKKISPVERKLSSKQMKVLKTSANSSLHSSDDDQKTMSRKTSRKVPKILSRDGSFVTRISRKISRLSDKRKHNIKSSSLDEPHVGAPVSLDRTPWNTSHLMTSSTSDLSTPSLYRNNRHVPQYKSWDVLSCDSGFATHSRIDSPEQSPAKQTTEVSKQTLEEIAVSTLHRIFIFHFNTFIS